MKYVWWGIGAILLVVVVVIVLIPSERAPEAPQVEAPTEEITEPASLPEPEVIAIGASVENRVIETYRFGDGATELLLVGGMHGGYEWNSVLLAYEMIDYLTNDPGLIPKDMTISIIPNLNPDGVAKLGLEGRFALADISNPSTRVAEGRFNANNVDLNRNFDCKWAPESTWRGATVSAGTGPFSEPEAQALRDYVLEHRPAGVVFWHSQANNVYASECYDGPLPETLTLMNSYAKAGGYGAVPSFDAYPITGDAEGWLASIGIPAITVELESYQSLEWTRNLAGFNAIVSHYQDTHLAR